MQFCTLPPLFLLTFYVIGVRVSPSFLLSIHRGKSALAIYVPEVKVATRSVRNLEILDWIDREWQSSPGSIGTGSRNFRVFRERSGFLEKVRDSWT